MVSDRHAVNERSNLCGNISDGRGGNSGHSMDPSIARVRGFGLFVH